MIILGGLGCKTVVAASVNDFYFEDFTGDYYLSRDEEGVSHLRVRESVTAVFPNYNQNKGICRQIAFTNQDGANITLPSLTRSDIKLTRNGMTEPIYSIDKEHGYYNVCTGTEEYVLGRQTYVFEYEFERVVTDFEAYQELYWDTNGNGASQKFETVTARVHFVDGVATDYTGQAWCYVGKYGASGQDRCVITRIPDGVEFTAWDLTAHENLTYDVELNPGAFVVPEPEKSYALVWFLVGCGAALLLSLYYPVRKLMKVREKRKYYRECFVKPEYQPHPDYSVEEMAEVYLGRTKEERVAAMLAMIVRKQVELVKEGESRRKGWKLVVKDMAGMSSAEKTLLRILHGGGVVSVGDTIELKRRTATSSLVSLGRTSRDNVLSALKRHELVTDKYKIGGSSTSTASNAVAIVITLVMFAMPIMAVMIELYDEIMYDPLIANRLALSDKFLPILFWMIMATVVIWWILRRMAHKYEVRTMKGLAASRYMDGVKMYIRMAEAERLKFLQSVEGADMSDEGVVHLYEKLLPYAAVLGLEGSWMRELEKYYQLQGVNEPSWYAQGLTVHDVYYVSALSASMSRSSTTMSSSGSGSGSGGWSSSGSSGGGGGGFSGGGGGGGGFSGR